MENQEKTTLFDPGFAPIVMNSIGQVGYTYYMFSAVSNLKLKKINFPNVFRKIEKLLKENVAFYLGCLLWASVISKVENSKIEGNKLLGENAKEEEYTSEINFLIGFIEHDSTRDCKYYLNKPYKADEKYLNILKAYKEFLIVNNGFVNCENTNQIILPKSIKVLDEGSAVKAQEAIKKAINDKDLVELFDVYNLIFD